MASVNTYYYDLALAGIISGATRFDITSTEATTYTQATTTYTLGNKTSITLTGPTGSTSRAATVPIISGGSVTGTGTAAFWALTDPANSRLVATGSLASSQSVTSGNTFSTTATYTVTINGAT